MLRWSWLKLRTPPLLQSATGRRKIDPASALLHRMDHPRFWQGRRNELQQRDSLGLARMHRSVRHSDLFSNRYNIERQSEPWHWPQGIENETDEVCAVQPACA